MLSIIDKKKRVIIIGGLFLVSIFIFSIFIIINSKKEDDIFSEMNNLNTVSSNIDGENNLKNADSKLMYVHIVGEVENSGVYNLVDGERIVDIIKKAGGVTEFADLSKVNLAYKLLDGQKIIIPNINDEIDNNFAYVISNAGSNVVENDKTVNKININLASQEDLQSINGIGESTAKKIIDYRNKNGYFKSIEDLTNISRYWK